MNIYLLLIDHERHFFYSDVGEAAEAAEQETHRAAASQSRLKAWAMRRLERFREEWESSRHGLMHWPRRLWDWLHSFSHPDEAMWVRLRTARWITLHYPASRTETEVREIWRGYLSEEWWRHGLWLVTNAAICPFAFALFLLPGPNVIGYWFLYRTIHHALVIWGIGKVRRGVVPVEYQALEQLDIPVSSDGLGQASHPVLRPDALALAEHIARRQKKP